VRADREERHHYRDERVDRVQVGPAGAQRPGGSAYREQRAERRPPPPGQRHGDQHGQQRQWQLRLKAGGHPRLGLPDRQHPGRQQHIGQRRAQPGQPGPGHRRNASRPAHASTVRRAPGPRIVRGDDPCRPGRRHRSAANPPSQIRGSSARPATGPRRRA
jgi:hypothetical protein